MAESAYPKGRETKNGEEQQQMSFDQLAKIKGWSKDDIRKCLDLPKKKMQPGQLIIRIPPDLLEDPFKNKPVSNAEQEYNALETRFYNTLSQVTFSTKAQSGMRVGTGTNRTNHVRVTISGARTSDVRLHVEKGSVDATINMGTPPK